MKIRHKFPRKVHEIAHFTIRMSDGTQLAARMWLPADAESNPVPAILEYIPYRKRDLTAARDVGHHPYIAGYGYASVRVDLRGSGESEGILTDEYLQQELDDGVEVINWLAQQKWCSGAVGMIGISWGGFNGLQLAALQPEPLKAVVSICSTDDRYTDDVHYMGGCLLGDNLSWASTMFDQNTHPPDPLLVGEKWREMWMQRLEKSGLWLEKWMRRQHRDEYWKHGSVCEDYTAIKCPVMAVSGWADGYSNTVFRLMSHLSVPRKGLIGPWSHKYPHEGVPGPAIGFLQEVLRWWDRWLKAEENGIENEPMFRVWMQDSVPPTTSYRERPGRWIAEDSWPSKNILEHTLILDQGRLASTTEEVPEKPLTIQSPLSVGLFAGKWCSYQAPPDLPHDQRQEDGGALVFESEALEADLEIFGSPKVELEFSSNRPVAMVAARLSDVAPDDKATRVTYGLLNLTHRASHENPQPLVPGKRYTTSVVLNGVAQRFPKGHRLRLSLSTSYWPLAWPSPEPVQLTVYAACSSFLLPLRAPRSEDADLRPFDEPEAAAPLPITLIRPGEESWKVIKELGKDISTMEVLLDTGTTRYDEINLEISSRTRETYSFTNDEYNSLSGETRWERKFKREDWEIRTVTRTLLTSNETEFRIRADLDAYEGPSRVFSRSWDSRIPRNLV
ncbi:MAG: CocE/NonD family hydrolase [Spirochaetaceae bacterium]|nr:CocE/NonD family hydrolase [Spirochaetaceae bacterium]MCF7951332.1 CocE/NonD family hydrolase [Spirochaetaceae bacterium]